MMGVINLVAPNAPALPPKPFPANLSDISAPSISRPSTLFFFPLEKNCPTASTTRPLNILSSGNDGKKNLFLFGRRHN